MSKIVFKINGKQYEADGRIGPEVSLNDYIRNVAGLRGTKAMCHEGGCGACVVSIRTSSGAKDRVFAVNSCLVSVFSCEGWEVMTVEGLRQNDSYHPLQVRLAGFNGTQCGYCTPGWIMNMYSIYESKNKSLTMEEIENSFAGNICRCTGYRPIADAFKSFAKDAHKNLLKKVVDLEDLGFIKNCKIKCEKDCKNDRNENKNCKEETKECTNIKFNIEQDMIVIDCGDHLWYRVFNLMDVFKAMSGGDYKVVAGNTGQGVYHITGYPRKVIDIRNVPELNGHLIDVNLILGACVTLTEAMKLFRQLSEANEDFLYLRQFYEHMDLVAHLPVRNIGTIGGNLLLKNQNGGFPSDLFLLFETVGAMVTVAESPKSSKVVSLPEFLKTDMKGKLLLNVLLPPLGRSCTFKSFKIMPRSQNAHAIVNAGFLFKLHHNNLLQNATIVFGGLSPNFIHAVKTEAMLAGRDPFDEETLQMALKTLFDELVVDEAAPEPSSGYRKALALALYYKAILSLMPDNRINPKYRSGGDIIKRTTSNGMQVFDTDKDVWPLNQPIPKLEALLQCSGEAIFTNDVPRIENEVFCAFVTADVTPGSVVRDFDTAEAFKLPGVIAFYSAKDIPGKNSFITTDVPFFAANEELFCQDSVKFFGQPVGIIVADSFYIANKAAKYVKVEYSSISNNKPLLTIKEVLESKDKSERVINIETIEPTETGNDVRFVIEGEYNVGSQYHFTMEPQSCVVKPTEDGLEVYAATQWMDLVNIAVAKCLNLPVNRVTIIVRRLGGGYGGKISRSSQVACAAALVSHLQRRPCRFVLPLQTNMQVMGKRWPTYCKFETGVNVSGEIQYLKNEFYQDSGCAFNELIPSATAIHFTNCYNAKRWKISVNAVRTDTPSNTWCRGPGSTEGVAMIEHIMEKIAFSIGKDPMAVRMANIARNNPIPEMIKEIKTECNYNERLIEIQKFNDENRWRKRALKMLPLAMDIFYFGNYNCIVSIYHSDGSVAITHGGIEMGQGINTKAAQVCAYALGIPIDKISVKASSSFTSPNTMTTGGSIGSESVAFSTLKACEILKKRLQSVKEKLGDASWEQIVTEAFNSGVNLQASHMFSLSDDGVKPYKVYAICALEVEVDVLTGNNEVRRVDLLEDTGRSLSPEIDVTQIEGAFVMGLGYWTSEKLVYAPDSGRLHTDRTWNYKPPGLKDIPADLRVYLRRNVRNEFGVLQSKATGEPAISLAVTVTHAIREAVRAARLDAGLQDRWVDVENPCTVENVFLAMENNLQDYKLR